MKQNYVKELMQGLYTELKEASRAYYNGREELMPDAVFDDKLSLLASLEQSYPEWKQENSPTEQVGFGGTSDFLEKVKHPSKMLSLDKRYDIEEVADFFDGMYPVVGSLKGDGLTVVLTYEDHILVDAVTRGNGETGERILKAARTFVNVPEWIPFAGKLILRAEAVITRQEFERIVSEGGEYKNARNLASGTVRNLDPNVVATRHVEAHVFELVEIHPSVEDVIPEAIQVSDVAQREWLHWSQGFSCINYKLLKDKSEVIEYYKCVEDLRESYRYGTDGIVFCTDSLEKKTELGSTSKYPLYALAYKFPNKGQVTAVNSISWQAGMYSLTPVVSVDQIDFDGVSVQKATAHNLAFVLGRDAKGSVVRPPIVPGCSVKIERGGEVIPKIAEVFFEGTEVSDYEEADYPKNCPVCGAPTKVSGVELVCTNSNCTGKLKAKLRTAVSRDALNITGIGTKAIDMLISKGFVKQMADLLELEQFRSDIIRQDGYGEKKADKMIEEIEKAKQMPLANVIAALCIRGVGLEVARQITALMPNGLIDILSLEREDLLQIDGVGEVIADNIQDYLQNEDNVWFIASLIQNEFGTKVVTEKAQSEKLAGLSICITGTLSVDRNTMENFIRQHGGKPTGSVSGKTSYVVIGDSPGASKVTKAQKLGVAMISEDELRNLINEREELL